MKHLTVCAAVSLAALVAPAFAQNDPAQPAGHDQIGGMHDPDTAAAPLGSVAVQTEEKSRISDCYSQTKLSRACERMAQADIGDHEQNRDWHQTDEF
jgi:hypothetical protein